MLSFCLITGQLILRTVVVIWLLCVLYQMNITLSQSYNIARKSRIECLTL